MGKTINCNHCGKKIFREDNDLRKVCNACERLINIKEAIKTAQYEWSMGQNITFGKKNLMKKLITAMSKCTSIREIDDIIEYIRSTKIYMERDSIWLKISNIRENLC